MESMRKAPKLTDKEDIGKETLDSDLWSQLQDHIPLQTIYEKLAQPDLHRLRIVSKEWNHVALQWTLPKPSFLTIAAGSSFDYWDVRFLNGIVTYNSVSGKFQFNRHRLRLHYIETHVPPFEVEGLILCHNPDELEDPKPDDLKERGVFNVHNQTWHAIPDGPEQSKTNMSICGLLVDKTVKPYTFKLIEGNRHFKTQIYDSKSRSWSKTSSQLPSSLLKSNWDAYEYSCICNNNNVYISADTKMFWKYSLEDDKWTVMKFPKVRICKDYPEADNILGVWDGQIFTTRENYKKQRVSVWELVDSEGREWVEYARMPKELYEWLWKYDYGFLDLGDEMFSRSFFRDGYLLVCSWRFKGACANVLVLFNIAEKSWRKVDLPRRTVAFYEFELEPESSDESESSDVEADEDFVDEDDDYGERVYVPGQDAAIVDEDDDLDEEDDVDEDDDLDGEDDVDEDDEVDE